MQDISDFFGWVSAIFQGGKTEEICATVLLPTSVYVGDEVLFLSDIKQLVNIMTDYSAQLIQHGVKKSEFEILSQEKLRDGGIRATVKWTHLNASGGTVLTDEATYFCAFRDDSWKIVLIEVISGPNEIYRQIRRKN